MRARHVLESTAVIFFLLSAPVFPASNEADPAPQSKPQSEPSYKAEDWTVAIYPILAWAPVMGANISLPELPAIPSHPITGPTQGSTSGELNGVALFGLSVQKKWFVADISVIWASVGSSRDQPPVSIDTSAIFYDATAGVKVFRDLALTAGVRRLGMRIDAKLGDFPELTWKPGVTDPILGLELRHSLGKKWGVDLALKGGGFGVGSDVDLSGTGRLDWRFARHFGMTMGYGALHFQISSQATVNSVTYVRETNQTLHGPIFGFGIYF
jgi:hypothetical protein